VLTFTYSIGPDVRIRFSAKPDDRIRSMLKYNGFRWSPGAGLWWRRRISGAADFLSALDLALNGPRKAKCWMCGSPDGHFRSEGAATPVRCDECQAKFIAQREAVTGTHENLRLPSGKSTFVHSHPDRSDLDYEDRCRDACGL
jgi:hypothetical protein